MRLLVCAVSALLIVACTATKPATTPTQRIPARFDYSPPSRTKAGAAGMTVALIRPVFVGADHPEYFTPPFNEMASSMAGDFQELLTAKGFTIRGPFKTRDEMTYNEKTNSDFALEVHIILNPVYRRTFTPVTNWGTVLSAAPSNTFLMSGEVSLAGYLELNARSSQYGELLWKKNIDLDPVVFQYRGKIKWTGRPTMAEELQQDAEVYNIMSRQLEAYYTAAMNLAWQQIDPEEMKTIADQAKKADKRGS